MTIITTAIGNAAKLNKPRFVTKEDNLFAKISIYLRNQLKLGKEDSLFLFVKNSFQPSMDARVKDLCDVRKLPSSPYLCLTTDVFFSLLFRTLAPKTGN